MTKIKNKKTSKSNLKEINTDSGFQNTSWSFELDTIHQYAFWNDFLSKEECNKIVKQGKELRLKPGGVGTFNEQKEIRQSSISWIYPNVENAWLFRRATDAITNLNSRFFKFNISGLNEGFQFTNYKYPHGQYGKHVDRGFDLTIRKLSLSIQLTDPKKYKGGDLKLYVDSAKEGLTMEKKQGTLVLFPSFTMHEVMPLTKGERNSLVAWVTGKAFE